MKILTLSELISAVESNDMQYAIRNEPAFRYIDTKFLTICAHINRCDTNTAHVILSTSFGFYQIMGESVYQLGYTKPILDFWNSAADQENIFNLFIKSRGINYDLDEVIGDVVKRTNFAHHYNGNAIVYAERMESVYLESLK